MFDGFQPLFAALSPDQVNELAGSIVDVFQGESGTVSNIVAETAALTNNLADRQQVIDTLLTSLSSLLDTVGVHDTQLGQLIGNFDSLMTGLAGSPGQLGSAIDNLAAAESTTSSLINESQPTLNEDIQTLSPRHVKILTANQQGPRTGAQRLPRSGRHAHQDPEHGNWINVYLCNLTINVDGQLDISLIPGGESRQPVPESGHAAVRADRRPVRPHGELLVKRFRERNRALTGLVGIAVVICLVVGGPQVQQPPPHPRQRHLPAPTSPTPAAWPPETSSPSTG